MQRLHKIGLTVFAVRGLTAFAVRGLAVLAVRITHPSIQSPREPKGAPYQRCSPKKATVFAQASVAAAAL